MIPPEWKTTIPFAREVPGRGVCGLQSFVFTWGLLVNLRFDGMFYRYDARYCYPLFGDARAALRDWDGTGDPPEGWVKEKVSERTPGDPR